MHIIGAVLFVSSLLDVKVLPDHLIIRGDVGLILDAPDSSIGEMSGQYEYWLDCIVGDCNY